MTAPCCPDRAGQRGRPYTAHWFIWHDADGCPDANATWSLGGLPRSDVECAVTLRGMFETAGARLLWGEQTKQWYMWDGTGRYAAQPEPFAKEMTVWVASALRQAFDAVWARVITDLLQWTPAERARLGKQAVEAWKAHKAFMVKTWSDAGQRAVESVMARVHSTDMDRMDAFTGRIVVDNGVLEYSQIRREGMVRLMPHDPGKLVTKRAGKGLKWDPDAACPVFERFTRESVPDDDQRDWLLWRTAHTLFGNQPRKGFLNLIGARDSGKSTFTDLIAYICGDYAKSVPVETFLSKHAGDSGFRQHELMGARFVHTHEPNPGALYDVSFMKTLTGRDRMRTRTLYERPVEWVPQCTPFIGSNAPIRFSTADEAMMSRQEAVLFTRGYQVPDPWLLDRMKAEAPGILRLLMRYIEREFYSGLPDLPVSVIQLREQMAVATEDALEFVTEWIAEGRLRADDHAPVYKCAQVNPLYQHYKVWCEEAGVRPVGRKTFSGIIGRKYPVQKSHSKHFSGLVMVP